MAELYAGHRQTVLAQRLPTIMPPLTAIGCEASRSSRRVGPDRPPGGRPTPWLLLAQTGRRTSLAGHGARAGGRRRGRKLELAKRNRMGELRQDTLALLDQIQSGLDGLRSIASPFLRLAQASCPL